MKWCFYGVSRLLAFCILPFVATQSWASEVTRDFYVAPTGTIPSITEPHIGWTKVGCYDALTGEWLNCKFTQEIVGIKEPDSDINNNGGHLHPDHPLIEPEGASMKFDGMKCPIGVGPLEVCGYTQYTPNNLITHGIPQASGKIVKKLVIYTPPPNWPAGWWCYFGCDLTYTYIDIFNVEVPGLKPLPDPGSSDFYDKLRGGTGTHPEGDYAVPYALQMVSLIAENYWVLSSSKLSVNDMSLPEGGLFDLRNDWSTGKHKEHRVGTSVDINRLGIHCLDNKSLRMAVEMLAPPVVRNGKTKGPLLCENKDLPLDEGGGLYHIYLDQVSIEPLPMTHEPEEATVFPMRNEPGRLANRSSFGDDHDTRHRAPTHP